MKQINLESIKFGYCERCNCRSAHHNETCLYCVAEKNIGEKLYTNNPFKYEKCPNCEEIFKCKNK